MSLGNDPRRVAGRFEEPDAEECRKCDRRTYDTRRLCPDCRRELGWREYL